MMRQGPVYAISEETYVEPGFVLIVLKPCFTQEARLRYMEASLAGTLFECRCKGCSAKRSVVFAIDKARKVSSTKNLNRAPLT